MFHSRSKRARRRSWPIHAYVGPNGSGKSAAMVWDTLPSIDRGRPVLSTVRILDWRNPRECDDPDCAADPTSGHYRAGPEGVSVHAAAHPLWEPLTSWAQLLAAEACDVLLDEVTGVASSRESQGMPAPVANKLVQLRRADVVLRWTAPAWARADIIARETSQAVTYCRGFFPKSVAGSGDRLWRSRRMFWWRSYDAAEFEDFTLGKVERVRTAVNDLHWGPSSPALRAYDTFDSVSTVGTVTDSGRCYHCGGRRSVPRCECGPRPTSEVPVRVRRGAPPSAGFDAPTPDPDTATGLPLTSPADSGEG